MRFGVCLTYESYESGYDVCEKSTIFRMDMTLP